jgi:hypothetical protein
LYCCSDCGDVYELADSQSYAGTYTSPEPVSPADCRQVSGAIISVISTVPRFFAQPFIHLITKLPDINSLFLPAGLISLMLSTARSGGNCDS